MGTLRWNIEAYRNLLTEYEPEPECRPSRKHHSQVFQNQEYGIVGFWHSETSIIHLN